MGALNRNQTFSKQHDLVIQAGRWIRNVARGNLTRRAKSAQLPNVTCSRPAEIIMTNTIVVPIAVIIGFLVSLVLQNQQRVPFVCLFVLLNRALSI
jgi:hypothetical protein